MLSTYTDAIEHTLLVLAAIAGVATVLAPFLLAAYIAREPLRRTHWRINAWRYRTR